MKKKQQKRYTSEKELLVAIDNTKRLQIKATEEHERCLRTAKKRRASGFCSAEDYAYDEEQAKRAAKRGERYESKLRALGEKLSAFRTRLLPNMAHPDEGVV